jgi:hypothetical protein
MEFTTIPLLVERGDDLSLGPPCDVPAKGMKTQAIRFRGTCLRLKLSKAESLSVPWEPSTWGGGCSETRKTITFNISQPAFEALAELEDWCRQTLKSAHPSVQAIWRSRIRPAEKYSAAFTAKINLTGPHQARFFDEEARPAKPPLSWKGLSVNAIVDVRGIYIQRQSIGLMLEVTDLQYCKPSQPACPF